MPQIRPITDLRNTTEISNLCHARREPIFITKNGYGDMVIMSMSVFEKMTYLDDVVQKVEEGEKDIAQGKCSSGLDYFDELKRKYEV